MTNMEKYRPEKYYLFFHLLTFFYIDTKKVVKVTFLHTIQVKHY